MSKDTEENVRYKLMQTLEEKKKPKNIVYPTSTAKDNKELVKESINKIMGEIEEFVNSEETKMEIKFTEL